MPFRAEEVSHLARASSEETAGTSYKLQALPFDNLVDAPFVAFGTSIRTDWPRSSSFRLFSSRQASVPGKAVFPQLGHTTFIKLPTSSCLYRIINCRRMHKPRT